MTKTTKLGFNALAFLSLAVLMIAGQSCKKNDLTESSPVNNQEITQLKSFVASSTGLSTSQVEYNAAGRYFVAGKDLRISLADAKLRMKNDTMPSGVSANQRRYVYLVQPTKVSTITIYADNSVPADWITALDQSIANWNSTNSHVYMKRVTATTTTTTTTNPGKKKKQNTTTTTTVPSYNILVTTLYDNTTSMVAQAYMPDYYGNVGNEVDINTYYNYLNASYKTFALTHELGHSIGFTHTDGTYGDLIPGTPETDANSVMNSFVLPWNGFTGYDLLAVNTIYPK